MNREHSFPLKKRAQYKCTGWLIFSAVLFIFLMLPLSTYSIFREELSLDILNVLLLLFMIVCGIALILEFAMRMASKAVLKYSEILLMLLALFFAYNFYTGDYAGKVMEADADIFDRNYASYEIAIFLFVTALLTLGYQKLMPYFQGVMLLLILTSLGNFAPLFSKNVRATSDASESPLHDSNFLVFSNELNIVHVILDGMQALHFSLMLMSDESIKEKFPGFTFFPDALTSSEITYLSLGSIFSGRAWNGAGSIRKYLMDSGSLAGPSERLVKDRSFLNILSENQFLIQALVAPGSELENQRVYDDYFLTDMAEENATEGQYLRRLLDLTLIKVMPWQIKRLVYSDGDWLFSTNYVGQLPRASRILLFLEQYAVNITAADSQPTYKLFHFLSPHAPWTTGNDCSAVAANMDRDTRYAQARCAMLGVAKLMRGLKKIGVYDKSLIVIHGDHGLCDPRGLPKQGKKNLHIPNCVGNTNPLVMIKPPFDDGELRTSRNLVELTDVAPTILDHLSIVHGYKGVNVFDVDKTRSRTRYYYQFSPSRVLAYRQDKVDEVMRFSVNGPIAEADSWCLSSSGICTKK